MASKRGHRRWYWLASLFGLAAAASFWPRAAPPLVPVLLARPPRLAASAEWPTVQAGVARLRRQLQADPGSQPAQVALAQLFMREGRLTGNHPYYDAAAMQLLRAALHAAPGNFEARCCQAALYLTEHHAAEGLAAARQAQRLEPGSAYVQGLLADACLELGRYDEAATAATQQVRLRPDAGAYARLATVRELHGDDAGAEVALRRAVRLGEPGLEPTEWARVQLGLCYENSNRLPLAEACYQQAMANRPGYAYAWAGLGRVAAERRDYPAASRAFEQAWGSVPDYAFTHALITLYRRQGQDSLATRLARQAVSRLVQQATTANERDDLGHHTDRELALAFEQLGELDKALLYARREYERRPHNLGLNELLADVYYRRGEYAQALPYLQAARRTHWQSSLLLYHAGQLLRELGQPMAGATLLGQAHAAMPYLDPDLATDSQALRASH